ncbi:MAG: M3 family oligoendopeptidase [Bacilli bacterium]|nr:M3 family oligoendopeptidase [Bacilli bacterium]MBN2876514.1 M3 family oligoendopeptidase [Bacilli bacterium]
MKFEEFKYQRPDITKVQEELKQWNEIIGSDADFKTELEAIHKVFRILDAFDTQSTLASIRNAINTKDEFYEKEQEFFDINQPVLQASSSEFNKRLLRSKNREVLEQELGGLIFAQAELEEKTFKEEIIPDLQAENKLTTEYSKLLASAKIEFDGGTYNLSQMAPFMQKPDRDTRHRAQLAVSGFLAEKEGDLDRIYDELVKIRTKIAHTLGYPNFVQLGYDRLGRTDYTSVEVKRFRDQVYENIVPIVAKLADRKGKRIGISDYKSYDLTLSYKSGNPTPKGDRAWQVNNATKMYDELSGETGKFFHRMVDMNVLELDAKAGKSGGGWCTFIPEYDSPYIFANFNGTAHDVNVLTHEAGHAFQVYQSRAQIPPYRWPTLEACEIHSMSMEFLTWPWYHLFFEEDTEKAKFDHVASSLSFLPYGVLVDEFQHGIYEHPEMTPDERKILWRRIEKKYLPFKDYDDDSFMDKGTYWFRQGHIFSSPFYYIDYTLAQISAFEYFIRSRNDHEAAFENYLELCKLGGSKPYTGLLLSAELLNPFEKGTIASIIGPIKEFLDSVDDTKL